MEILRELNRLLGPEEGEEEKKDSVAGTAGEGVGKGAKTPEKLK